MWPFINKVIGRIKEIEKARKLMEKKYKDCNEIDSKLAQELRRVEVSGDSVFFNKK